MSLRRPRVSHIQDFDKVNPSNKTSRTETNNSARPSLPHQDGVVVRKSESVCFGGRWVRKGICILDWEKRGSNCQPPGDVSCFNERARIMR